MRIALVALIVPMLAFSSFSCKRLGATTHSTPDGQISVETPLGWQTANINNPHAKLELRTTNSEGWLMVIPEPKSDFKAGMTLDEYAAIVLNQFSNQSIVQNCNISAPRAMTINGYQAVQYDIHATVKGIRIAYLKTFYDTPNHFTQLILWTVPSKEAENQADFRTIAQSLHEHPGH